MGILRVLQIQVIKRTVFNVDLLQNSLIVADLIKKAVVEYLNEHLNIFKHSCLMWFYFQFSELCQAFFHLLL